MWRCLTADGTSIDSLRSSIAPEVFPIASSTSARVSRVAWWGPNSSIAASTNCFASAAVSGVARSPARLLLTCASSFGGNRLLAIASR